MYQSEVPTFKILEMITLARKDSYIKTIKKQCHLISCRIRGKSLFFCKNEEYTASVGDVIYVPYGLSYSQYCEGEEELICFHLDTDYDIHDVFLKFSTDKPVEMCSLFIKAAEIWKEKPPNYQFLCLSILYQILALCNAQFSSPNRIKYDFLQPVTDYIDTNFSNPDFAISDIYKKSGVSQTYFNRTFRETFGCTPSVYANRKRIEKAKHLLKTGGYTNEEICELCGFCEVKYFYVVFKRITGLTTSQYLKQLK